MSGHSKWSTIKRKKDVSDQKKGALFSKLSKNISLAMKQGGHDPETNAKLRLAIKSAKQASMPSENIKRTVEKAANTDEDNNIEGLLYEAYGPEGSALLIDVSTDNRNRIISQIKTALTKNGGKLAESGGAAHLFQKSGEILIEAADLKSTQKDQVVLELMDYGAEDVDEHKDSITAYFPLNIFADVTAKLESKGIKHNAHIMYKPVQPLSIKKRGRVILDKLIETLEDLDDVNKVYSNAK